MDAAGKERLYDKYMTRVYISTTNLQESSALRLLLLNLKMEIVGESSDWFTTVVQIPHSQVELLLVDWSVLPINSPNTALSELRKACPSALVVILISHLDSQKQAALSIDADMLIRKDETPKRMAERLQAIAEGIPA
jgi:DNA-binding NarL/FixJ family response regulator